MALQAIYVESAMSGVDKVYIDGILLFGGSNHICQNIKFLCNSNFTDIAETLL